MKKNIVFIGFMGSGKTTIGRRVAAKFGIDFYDTDEYIKKCEKMSVYDIITKKGHTYFEGAERFAVTNLADHQNCLISTGGGTIIDPYNREILKKNGILVWLRASAKTVYDNTNRSHNKRAEICNASIEEIDKMLKEREEFYKDCDIVVDVDDKDIDKIVSYICQQAKELEV